MLPFVSRGINAPWSKSDIKKYEAEGSQRDSVIYNGYYNSRILLTEKNIFLCSLDLSNNLYKNFYLVAVTRSIFYYIAFVPEALSLGELKNKELIKKLFLKLTLHKAFADSFDASITINDSIQLRDGCAIVVKVNANIGEFLFPKHGEITNLEIRKKFTALSNLYTRFCEERKAMIKALENYDAKIQEKENEIKKKLARVAIRKTTLAVTQMLLGIPPLPCGLDELFGLNDLSDLAYFGDITSSVIDSIDISDTLMV